MERTYKLIRLAGVSKKSYEDAVQNAIKAAAKTHTQLDWFQVIEQRGKVGGGKIAEYQVIIDAAYKLLP